MFSTKASRKRQIINDCLNGKTTQKEAILKLLQNAGGEGIHSFEFYRNYMAGGRNRVCDLKKEGYPITDRSEKYRGKAWGKRYILLPF